MKTIIMISAMWPSQDSAALSFAALTS